MDLRKIKKLIELAEGSGLTELEVRSGDESVRIVRPPPGSAAPAAAAAPVGVSTAAGQPVRAPMAGTFYAAPEPGSAPYLSVGTAVNAGDVLCIIESMKMMNEIKAERSGVCRTVAVANGQAVSAGDTLFLIG